MRIENRELYVSFWDEDSEAGVFALLVGWSDNLEPVVAYNFGLQMVAGRYQVFGNARDAERAATYWRHIPDEGS